MTGSDKVSEGADMAGWGVQQAEERHKKEASEYHAFYPLA